MREEADFGRGKKRKVDKPHLMQSTEARVSERKRETYCTDRADLLEACRWHGLQHPMQALCECRVGMRSPWNSHRTKYTISIL